MYDAIIIGGGPAGSSAAITLATGGARVILLEEKHMPRGKLCGEFITSECFPSLERMGVMNRVLAAGAQKLTRVSLVVASGKSVESSISEMSEGEPWAMSLSRARFDQVLFDRAREARAECIEGVAVKECLFDGGSPTGVQALLLSSGRNVRFEAPVIIDASGRNSRVMVGRRERVAGRRGSRLYALKAHLNGVDGIDHQVELCFFPQGYGGFARVEDGLVNLCFIVDERTLKQAGGDSSKVIDLSLKNNRHARHRLRAAEVVGKWYSAGPLTFGRRRLTRNGVIAIGDASGMIDPFTGTGIQIAMRTGEMAAEAMLHTEGMPTQNHIGSDFNNGQRTAPIESILARYSASYDNEFGRRMKAAGLLRSIAFSPAAASVLARILSRSPSLAKRMLRATRSARL